MQAITGSLAAVTGLTGLFGGLRGAKVGAGIGPMFSIISGQQQQQAAQDEAALLGRQGDIAYQESLQEAARKAREVKAFREQQALEFASGGGRLAGSPLGILEETRQLGQQEVSAIKQRGEALAGLYSAQGLQMLRRGSAAAFGGFANALQLQFDAKQRATAMRQQGLQSALAGFGTAANAFTGFKMPTFQFGGSSITPPAPSLTSIHGYLP